MHDNGTWSNEIIEFLTLQEDISVLLESESLIINSIISGYKLDDIKKFMLLEKFGVFLILIEAITKLGYKRGLEMKKFIVGAPYNLLSQGTKTTNYNYAVVDCESLNLAKDLADMMWGPGSWAIDWSQDRENHEKRLVTAHEVAIEQN